MPVNNKPGAESYFNRTSYSTPKYVSDDSIAFLDDSSGTPQVKLYRMNGDELETVTDYSEGIISLDASTKTETIMFGIDEGGDERQQLYTVALSELQPTRITHDDGAFFEPGGLSSDGKSVVYRTNTRDEATFDIGVTDIEGKSSEFWLKDGGQILPQVLGAPGALVIQSKSNGADDLLLVNGGTEPDNLTNQLDDHRIYSAVVDPSGGKVWVLSELGRECAGLFSYDLGSREFSLYFSADWEVELVTVSPDGKNLAISVNENGYSIPYILSATDPEDIRALNVPAGVVDGFSWAPDSQSAVFGVATSEQPSRIYQADLDGQTRVLLAAEESQSPETVKAKPVEFTSFDGRKIPGYLFLPEGEGPHPALIEIHGGPESQRRPDYSSVGAAIQYFVSKGIAVLALNIRGSIGYGHEYRHLDDKGKRLDALKDVEAAANWLGSRDDIDANRLSVYGISYGGFMTLTALTRLPQLWAAGAEMVGMAHLETFLERTGAWRRKHREGEYGSLESDREMLREVSPLPLVDQITAPLLVLHGRNDARVPLFESEQIVDAVSQGGVPVELVVYDDEGHVFGKRKNLVDAYTRIGDFLAEHLKV